MPPLPGFHTKNLAEAVEALSPDQLDLLPFGVTGLDPLNVVRLRNRCEQDLSGFGDSAALGRLFFVDVAPCLNTSAFKGRIDRARREGKLDIHFSFVCDFPVGLRELNVRVQSAGDGGCWIFMERRQQGDAGSGGKLEASEGS